MNEEEIRIGIQIFKSKVGYCFNYKDLEEVEYIFGRLATTQQENTILKENAIHNDEVVDKVNWENNLLKQQLKDKDELLSQIYEYVNVDNHLGLDMSSKEQGKRIVRDCVLNMFELETNKED